jgi:hypothetical protein
MASSDPRLASPLPTAISALRFVAWIAVVTAGCLAWYERKYMISTPVMGMNWVLLRPRSELLKPVSPTRSSLLGVAVGLGLLLGLVNLIFLVVTYVSPHVDPAVAERLATHPVSIGTAWFLVLYVGATTWKRQVAPRDA